MTSRGPRGRPAATSTLLDSRSVVFSVRAYGTKLGVGAHRSQQAVCSQGNFGHLLRQRPASLGGELGGLGEAASSLASPNQVVARRRPHSEDLQSLRALGAADDEDDDEVDEDEEDDDVFLANDALGLSAFPRAHRQRLSSSGNSNEDASDEDDPR